MKIGLIVLEKAHSRENNHDTAFTSSKFTRVKLCHSWCQTKCFCCFYSLHKDHCHLVEFSHCPYFGLLFHLCKMMTREFGISPIEDL